jgi:ATP-dependent protease ClpP protease subunit
MAGTIIELNSDNSIKFDQAFTAKYVAEKQIEATKLCRKNLGSQIYISLYTPGGSISAGRRYFDTLKALPCKFNTITIFAASMGYQAVQQLNKRFMIPSGTLMSHRASIGGLSGEVYGEADSVLRNIKDTVDELDQDAADRVGITLEKYKKDISDELWLTGKKALATNHIDELVFVKCHKSLLTTREQTVEVMFGSFTATFSNCPLVIGPVESNNKDELIKLKKYYNDLSVSIYWEL